MKYVLLIVSFFWASNSFAHKDKVISKSYGNVEVVFSTGFYYEEINKGLIIGEYAEMLSKKLNYSEPIVLFFKHNYTSYEERYYKINPIREGPDSNLKNQIFIKMKDSEYDICEVLKLIEYSISNSNKDIDGLSILKKLKDSTSTAIVSVLNNKVYRPNVVNELMISKRDGVSYYYKNEECFMFVKRDNKENVLFSSKNIYQFSKRGDFSFLVFDTKESFYFISSIKLDEKPKKVIVRNVDNQFLPYLIKGISYSMTSITFQKYRNRKNERVMIYSHHDEKLIQNIGNFID